MAGAGSQKLKEMALAMEKQDHDLQDALGTDAKADGAEHVINMKGVGTFRVADGHDTADEQRRLLAKRSLAEEKGAPVSMRTIYVMVALAVGLACFLLWLLFGGSRGGDQARSIPPLDDLWALAVRAVAQWSATLRSLCWVDQEVAAPPFLTASALLEAQGAEACPDWRWIPEACLGSASSVSESAYIKCKSFMATSGYTIEKLRGCGMMN